jgi:ribosomal protein L29
MKRNDIIEAHGKTIAELQKLLHDAKEALATLRLDHAQNKVKNTRELFTKRKAIAVFMTILNVKKKSAVTEVVADKGGKE